MGTQSGTRTSWVVDAAHSKISFKVKHLMISNVAGDFTQFEGAVTTEGDDFATSSIQFSINAASVNTEMADRDAHLRSADFFDVENHPKITFEANGLQHVKDDMYEVTGNLTIKGTTKAITLSVEYGGIMTDPWGNVKAGFAITGKLKRKEWGLSWNAALEAGGVMVGEEVKLNADLELTKVAS